MINTLLPYSVTFIIYSNISKENGIHLQDFGNFFFGNLSVKIS